MEAVAIYGGSILATSQFYSEARSRSNLLLHNNASQKQLTLSSCQTSLFSCSPSRPRRGPTKTRIFLPHLVASMEHYRDLKSKSFFPKLMEYITSGPVVAMEHRPW